MTDAVSPSIAGFGRPVSRRVSRRAITRPVRIDAQFGDRFRDVLAQAQRGDGRAFAEIDSSLGGRIHAFVASRGAEDPGGMTNEVLLGAFTSIGSFSGSESAFVGWVFRIARNKLIDEHRYRSRRLESAESLDPAHATPAASAEEAVLDRVELSEAYGLLAGLTDEQREIVLLRVVSELSFAEIATALDKRVGAVKACYRRAIKSAARAAAGTA